MQINYKGNPYKSDNGFLPYLIADGVKYCGYEKIINFMQKTQDISLAPASSQLAYLHENLYPYFMYNLFGNPQNTDDIRTVYAKRTPFPFNFFCPGRYFRKTDEICQQIGNFSIEDKIDQHNIVEMSFKAKKILNWINEKLSKNIFFLDERPCEIDATIYAYLAIIIKFQLPNNQLQSHGNQNEHLVKYVDRLTKTYFTAEEIFECTTKSQQQEKTDKKVYTGQEDEEPPSVVRKRYILSGVVATVAMLSYAVFIGMFKMIKPSMQHDDEIGFGFDEINTQDENDED